MCRREGRSATDHMMCVRFVRRRNSGLAIFLRQRGRAVADFFAVARRVNFLLIREDSDELLIRTSYKRGQRRTSYKNFL